MRGGKTTRPERKSKLCFLCAAFPSFAPVTTPSSLVLLFALRIHPRGARPKRTTGEPGFSKAYLYLGTTCETRRRDEIRELERRSSLHHLEPIKTLFGGIFNFTTLVVICSWRNSWFGRHCSGNPDSEILECPFFFSFSSHQR